MTTTTTKRRLSAALAALMLLAACANPIRQAEEYAAQDDWMKAVLEYRKALATHPGDIEIRSRLKQTELKAADFYYQRGARLMDLGNLDGAIVQFQQGLAAMPEHGKLLQAMNEALARKDAGGLYQEALNYHAAGKEADALRQLRKALDLYPDHKEAAALYAELAKKEDERSGKGLALRSKAPITLNFRETELKTAFEFLAKSFGINVIFDEAVKNVPVTLFATDVTFEQALGLMLSTTKTFYKRIGPNSILIAPDTKDKRGQYEDYFVRAFQLNTVKAKDMADIIKGVLAVKKMTIDEQLNTLVVRDTEDVLQLVERIVAESDRKPAEMILEVEILEVNRTKAEKLGLDFGSYSVTASVPPFPIGTSLRAAAYSSGTITVPSATLRFFKQDVDAKTLANPRIRVLNGKLAKIHIGDRVPLRAATIQDATGQVRTTYDYRDIGIRLTVEPQIHLDNSATVKLGLEVSSLGQNLGTAAEPAYSIGTRNAETYMLLRDGETAILGGLIREDELKNRTSIPGLGDIPALGSLFTSYDDSRDRTDVLLTITPRVVRGWDVPPKNARTFYSGTENLYADKPLFAALQVAAEHGVAPQDSATPAPPSSAAAGRAGPPAAAPGALLAFSESVYEAALDQEFEIRLVGSHLASAASVPVEILYNPQLIAFVRAEPGVVAADSFSAEPDATHGVVSLKMQFAADAAPADNAALARLVMRGLQPGISYLVYRTPGIRTSSGETLNAQVRASRVVVK